MADDLKISVRTFMKRYTHKVYGRRSLNEHRTEHGYDCTFLDRGSDGKALCTVYSTRPQQCRTWPFWKENLGSPDQWEHTKQTCPGSGQGRLYPIEKIRIIRDSTPDL